MSLLICRYNRVYAFPGDDITLSSHLSPETSAVPMEVRWFRGTECIYLYKNGQVSVGRGYDGRASLMTEELKRGNVSLVLKSIAPMDTGKYSCQVLTGHNKAEKSIHLYMSGMEPLSPDRAGPQFTEQDDVDRDESVLILELRKLLQQRERELEDKSKELETTKEMLRTKSDLLLYKDADLEGASREAIRNEERLREALSELEEVKTQVEGLRRDLEGLRRDLQEKDALVQELRGFLRDKERELEEEKKRREEERPEEQAADGSEVTAGDRADGEESLRVIELEELLQKTETDLAEESERLEAAAGALRQATERLRQREKEVEDLSRERDEYGEHVNAEMEMCLRELETLGQKLREKNQQVEELRGVLQAKEREELPQEKDKPQELPVEDLETWIRRDRDLRRRREEDEKADELEGEFREYVSAVQELMATKHETMEAWEKMASVLQDKLRVAETDEEREALGTQLEEAAEMRRQSREQIARLSESVEEKRNAVEERHKREVQEIREKYDAVETHILKTLLPEIQAYFQNVLGDARCRIAAGGQAPSGKNEEAETDAADPGEDASSAMNGAEG